MPQDRRGLPRGATSESDPMEFTGKANAAHMACAAKLSKQGGLGKNFLKSFFFALISHHVKCEVRDSNQLVEFATASRSTSNEVYISTSDVVYVVACLALRLPTHALSPSAPFFCPFSPIYPTSSTNFHGIVFHVRK